MSLVFSWVTGPKFTKFLHDTEASFSAVNTDIEVVISHFVLDWQSDKCRGEIFCPIFATKLVAMATSLKISEKESRIDHLQFNIYHMVQRLWKSVQRILRYFGSERTSLVRHKIGCHGNVPWGIGKNGPDQENSRKYLPFGKKIVKIGPVDTEIALFILKKKEEINASKIDSPSGKFAERAK